MQVRNLIFIVLMICSVISIAGGCAYKKDIVQAPCVLPNSISYSIDVVPILQANCYRCHSSTTLSSGILLDNYDALKFYAQNGYLYGCIAHLSGYPPMPEDGGKLSDCNIALIKNWIDSGEPQ